MNAKNSVVIFHSSTNVKSGMTHPVVHVERWYRMEMSRIIITLSYHLLQTNQMAEKTKVRVGMDAETTDRTKAKPFFFTNERNPVLSVGPRRADRRYRSLSFWSFIGVFFSFRHLLRGRISRIMCFDFASKKSNKFNVPSAIEGHLFEATSITGGAFTAAFSILEQSKSNN